MRKKVLPLFIIIPIFILGFIQSGFSNKTNPPAAHTGAPSEPSCGFSGSTNSCHGATSGPNASTLLALNTDVELLVSGVAMTSNFAYTADSIYEMSFKINNPTSLCGFSLSVKNNGNGLAGTLSIPTGSSAKLNSANSSYINQNGQAGISEWTFLWQAPATGNGDVTFYASANRSNNNNAWSGDEIIPFKKEVSEGSTVSIKTQALLNAFSLKGNPILNNKLSFDLIVKEPKQYFISVYDLAGKQVYFETKTFHAGLKEINIDIAEKGIYLLNIRTNKNESSTIKIMN